MIDTIFKLGWRYILTLGIFIFISSCSLPKKQIVKVVFYNVENLFDTEDDLLTNDDEFTSQGRLQWNMDRYNHKLDQISKVLLALGPADLIGLAEVENQKVLDDLIHTEPLRKLPYEILHVDSPDQRGIDVALLYRTDKFRLLQGFASPLDIGVATRDILFAKLQHIKGDTLNVFINHWPSRSGSIAKTEPRRLMAAQHLHKLLQEITDANPNGNIVVMGDFNDNPSDLSLQSLVSGDATLSLSPLLVNPFAKLAENGVGSYNYRGRWDMLDQILISPSIATNSSTWKIMDFGVFKKPWMLFEHPEHGLTPDRTYGGTNYYGGFSDHLPVYLELKYAPNR